MTITNIALDNLDKHWAVTAFGEDHRQEAFELAKLRFIKEAIGNQLDIEILGHNEDSEPLERLATAYEIAAIEGINELLYQSSEEGEFLRSQAQAGAYRAFEIRRIMPVPKDEESRYFHILHLCALAYCGDRWADIRRWLKEHPLVNQDLGSVDGAWDYRILVHLYDCWIRLFRKNRWNDLSEIADIIVRLREEQSQYEPQLLNKEKGHRARLLAFRLIALYHWAKATELLATYMLQGEPISISTELDQHFEAAIDAALSSQDPALEVLLRWLHVASKRMVMGSIWHVAQSVNSRIMEFVKNVTKSRGLFELLPPQKVALQEQGLLDQANRAIVIDMPTSGGKTLLAQFRILQAISQFDVDKGWIAYVAPTRALVAQLTRRLREDFEPIGVRVEHLTAAVEIDSFEDALLTAEDEENHFDILISTPEKLHLVIRNQKITRPLSLVVMDEAHNIQDEERGLRIELLLATIKRDCPYANFLLLMPHVPNASDLVRWLSPEAGKTISLGTSIWQPNERIIGMYKIKHEQARGDWSLEFETLTTTRKTVHLQGTHKVGSNRPLNIPFSTAKSQTNQTGAIAKVFSERGTSIAIASSIPDTWSMARSIEKNLSSCDSDEISLVQRFLATEISPHFELIKLLSAGVAVHHAGLSEEARSLIEWLAENNKLRVLCATTTITQGINFPVSSVFLASRYFPIKNRKKEMSKLAFWNLAGRAGRIDQDSLGVVGLCAGENPNEIIKYVKDAIDNLISRLVKLLDDVEMAGELNNLQSIIKQDQWADFRGYIAHLWNDKRNLDAVLAETEQILRNTFGYGILQTRSGERGRTKAKALLDATKRYASELSNHPENAVLSDVTGFAPEGVRAAIIGMNQLEKKLSLSDWEPSSIFGGHEKSMLPQLIGVMMRVPQLRESFDDLISKGLGNSNIANVAYDWVMGSSIEQIAKQYFSGAGGNLTDAITSTCKSIY